MKYIVIAGSIVSGLGKGIIVSMISKMLIDSGYKITIIKIDPYLNKNAGLLSPLDHGEVFVLEDGSEVDLDFGNYERYTNLRIRGDNNITTGKIYDKIIKNERNGKYLGSTVQTIPHMTNQIKEEIKETSKISIDQTGEEPDICIIEIGGTITDIESQVYIETIRQMMHEEDDVKFILLTLIIELYGELKTKPSQNAIRNINSLGIYPDLIMCRTLYSEMMNEDVYNKLRIYNKNIIHIPTVKNIEDIIQILENERIYERIGINGKYNNVVEQNNKMKGDVKIGIIGKYTKLKDSYNSIIKNLEIICKDNQQRLEIIWISSYEFNEDIIKKVDGVIIPGGFGEGGIDGKIKSMKYCRENDIPLLGICLGFQLGLIEFGRKIGLNVGSEESIDNNKQINIIKKREGGDMKTGLIANTIIKNTKIREIYGEDIIEERHRHRYEFDSQYRKLMEKEGLIFNIYDNNDKYTGFEIKGHPYYICVQYHPEYKKRPKLFEELIRTINEKQNIIKIYTDGACKNNGKKNCKSGYGIYIPSKGIEISESYNDRPSNQRAELKAILEGVRISKGCNIIICTDSLYSIKCLTEWNKKWVKMNWINSKNEEVKNKELIMEIMKEMEGNHVEFRHIRAHQVEPNDVNAEEYEDWFGNNMADKLAVKAIK